MHPPWGNGPSALFDDVPGYGVGDLRRARVVGDLEFGSPNGNRIGRIDHDDVLAAGHHHARAVSGDRDGVREAADDGRAVVASDRLGAVAAPDDDLATYGRDGRAG